MVLKWMTEPANAEQNSKQKNDIFSMASRVLQNYCYLLTNGSTKFGYESQKENEFCVVVVESVMPMPCNVNVSYADKSQNQLASVVPKFLFLFLKRYKKKKNKFSLEIL